MYEGIENESPKSKRHKSQEVESTTNFSESFIGKAFEYIKSLIETWKKEELKEEVLKIQGFIERRYII